MKTEFHAGDLVQLKSGGPIMTVVENSHDGRYFCQWFAGKKLEAGHFNASTLAKVDEESDE